MVERNRGAPLGRKVLSEGVIIQKLESDFRPGAAVRDLSRECPVKPKSGHQPSFLILSYDSRKRSFHSTLELISSQHIHNFLDRTT